MILMRSTSESKDQKITLSAVEWVVFYYYTDRNFKRKFSNLSVLETNGFQVEDVREVDDLSAYSNGSDISGLDEDIANYL